MHSLAHNLHMGVQAAYLIRLQAAKGTAKQALKVTDQLLAARPALLPDYVSIAKSTGKLSHTVMLYGLLDLYMQYEFAELVCARLAMPNCETDCMLQLLLTCTYPVLVSCTANFLQY